MTLELRRPVLWLDIDGTVRHGADQRNGLFVKTADDVVLFPEVPALLAAYKKARWRIVGVSNQGGIALGHLTTRDVMENMQRTHDLSGGYFDRISFCRHHPSASEPEMAICWCRKPRIGMLVEAGISMACQFGECYPPHLGLFVGDRPEDQACADAAGVAFMDAVEWRRLNPADIR